MIKSINSTWHFDTKDQIIKLYEPYKWRVDENVLYRDEHYIITAITEDYMEFWLEKINDC